MRYGGHDKHVQDVLQGVSSRLDLAVKSAVIHTARKTLHGSFSLGPGVESSKWQPVMRQKRPCSSHV